MFHYDVLKKKYGDNLQRLLTDTESLMYEVCTEDFYQDMWVMKDEFHLASYPKSSHFYDPTNNKVVGKVKDEASGQSISEFVGLKPMMASFQRINYPSHVEAAFTTKKPTKGIQRAAVAKLRDEQ